MNRAFPIHRPTLGGLAYAVVVSAVVYGLVLVLIQALAPALMASAADRASLFAAALWGGLLNACGLTIVQDGQPRASLLCLNIGGIFLWSALIHAWWG